jgi:hypothetical protein
MKRAKRQPELFSRAAEQAAPLAKQPAERIPEYRESTPCRHNLCPGCGVHIAPLLSVKKQDGRLYVDPERSRLVCQGCAGDAELNRRVSRETAEQRGYGFLEAA